MENCPHSIKVLMAEDEPEVLDVMARKVASVGYVVVTARDGEEAWDKIQKESPDVIILDLIMPKKNGFEVLKRVRECSTADKWQPVIIVSAKKELQDLQEGYALEADHYIAKPCQMEDILKSIRLMVSLIPQHEKPCPSPGNNKT